MWFISTDFPTRLFFLMRRFQIGCKMTYSSRTDVLRFSMKVKKGAAVLGYLMGKRALWKSKTPG